eukprot:TRINITY_DN366_c0_g1_i6.p1 TRINITY_DN366_c0_g1~~TRINITY_DN366_c0_g1_i6.p1  ORF type:complete len:803 (-),score=198.29 TRINITY_DN366_c0_g1_i6:701-3109(-)
MCIRDRYMGSQMKKKKNWGKERVVYVKKTQQAPVSSDQSSIPAGSAPTVEPHAREEEKAKPYDSSYGYQPYYQERQEEHYIPEKYARKLREYEESANQEYAGSSTEYSYHPHIEKVIYRARESKYKDYSKDKAAVSFYFGDFFKQFPNLNERTKEIIKGLCECTQECLICQNKIFQKTKIWNCERCVQPFHLGCIKRWIVQVNYGEQYDQLSGKSSMQKLKDDEVHWSCPNCAVHYTALCPRYKCFCGKRECPDFNPYAMPHSCGKPCDKRRHPWCMHMTCNVLCHPGQCDPCAEQIELACFCGKQKQMVFCAAANNKQSCGQICGRQLACGKHFCQEICHEKEQCSRCNVKVINKCYCGKVEKDVRCGNEQFSCEQLCEKTLKCGAHKCSKLCHSGECENCPLSPDLMSTCACGKMSQELLTGAKREKCTDEIAICGMPCEKILPCGKHKCKNSCHIGPCTPCKESVVQRCRCGETNRNVNCYYVNYPPESLAALKVTKEETEFICKKRCECFKKCKKHKCGRLCCDVVKKYGNRLQDDPSGFHLCYIKCDRLLDCKKHRCPDFCHLGFCKLCPIISNQPLFCACGKTKKEPPIRCEDEPPSCANSCPKILPCGHQCGNKCHFGPCPPCYSLVPSKPCKCGREQLFHVQCSLTNLSCGKRCDKDLPCGHKCGKQCHALGDCYGSNENKEGQKEVKSCGQKCNKQREFCSHRCQELCHPGKECPKEPCTAMMFIYCPCKHRKETVKCGVTTAPDVRTLECNEECAKIKRRFEFDKFAGSKAEGDVPSNPDYYPEKNAQFGKT